MGECGYAYNYFMYNMGGRWDAPPPQKFKMIDIMIDFRARSRLMSFYPKI